jgi:spore coat protein A, manganese oxidase
MADDTDAGCGCLLLLLFFFLVGSIAGGAGPTPTPTPTPNIARCAPATAGRACLIAGDFDNDGKTDFAVWRPSDGKWYIMDSSTGTQRIPIPQLGNVDDIAVPGNYDYDGDGKTDPAVWSPGTGTGTGTWTIMDSKPPYTKHPPQTLGGAGDIPVPGNYDYDSDGKTDPAVWSPGTGTGTGTWTIMDSKPPNTKHIQTFGDAGDIPVPGDYVDGDGKTDFAVWRPSDGKWYIKDRSTGTEHSSSKKWGNKSDILVPGNYVGDGKTDFAFWRPGNGTWYVSDFSAANEDAVQLGKVGDIPV